MSNQKFGLIYVIVGVIFIVVSFAADSIGLGADPSVMGWKQYLGMAAGLVLVLLGILRIRKK